MIAAIERDRGTAYRVPVDVIPDAWDRLCCGDLDREALVDLETGFLGESEDLAGVAKLIAAQGLQSSPDREQGGLPPVDIEAWPFTVLPWELAAQELVPMVEAGRLVPIRGSYWFAV